MVARTPRAEDLQPGQSAPPLTKIARNFASASENKIHSDEEARRYGLKGGLVGGVSLYAYASELLVALLGPRWLQSGRASVRFVRPVYDGETVNVIATRAAIAGGEGLRLEYVILAPEGQTCVLGDAAVGENPPALPEWRYELWPGRASLRGERPPLTPQSIPLGAALDRHTVLFDPETVQRYADDHEDPGAWYRGGSVFGLPIVPPGLIAGQVARLLRENFSYGPSVHTASEIQHLAVPLAGGEYTVDAAIVETYNKRGSDYLVADVLVRDHNGEPVTRIRHSSIFNFAPRG